MQLITEKKRNRGSVLSIHRNNNSYENSYDSLSVYFYFISRIVSYLYGFQYMLDAQLTRLHASPIGFLNQ